MKKLVVLSALLGLLALPMFAADMSFGGDVTFGFLTDFSGDVETEKVDTTIDFKGVIDDFNTLAISLDQIENAPETDGATSPGLEKAFVKSDIGKWLGLPVGLVVQWGWDDPDWNAFGDITNYGNTGIYISPDEYWGLDIVVTYKMLEFELAGNPGAANVVADLGYLLAGLAVKEPIKGLNAELYYFQNASALDEFGEGQIAFDAAYALELGDIGLTAAPGFYYDMAAETYFWGLALQGTYSMFTANLGVSGNDVDFLDWLDFDVVAALLEGKLDVYAGVEMSFADGTDAFQGLDIGVNANIGKVDAQVGYVVTSNAEGEIDGWFTMPTDGGFYVLFDVNY